MSEMQSFDKFVGVVVTGSLVARDGNMQFDVEHTLGSGFVIDSDKALVATCEHVLPEQDRNLSVAFFCNDGVGGWLVSIVDTRSIKQWGDEDLIIFQCKDLTGNPQKGFRSVNINSRKLLLAEKVIALGMPKDHMAINSPGNNNLTIRAMTGYVVTTYDRTAEIASPLIKGMSGGPVICASGDVIGISIKNKRVALDLEVVSDESTTEDGITEKYSYGEYQRFGCFYHTSSFSNWLSKTVSEF